MLWNGMFDDLKSRSGAPWIPLRDGVEICDLHKKDTLHIALLRYAPGARVPRHRHSGDEHIFVLDGAQADERATYSAGSYVFNAKDTVHEVFSAHGCLVLIHWLGPVEFLVP